MLCIHEPLIYFRNLKFSVDRYQIKFKGYKPQIYMYVCMYQGMVIKKFES